MKKKQTFEETLRGFEYKVDLRTAFEDFLTMTICSFGLNPITGKSCDEELYMETIAKYKDDNLRFEFSKLLACLVTEMSERRESDLGWDVLGECYEQSMQRKGLSQFFTPWPICVFMTQSACEETVSNPEGKQPLRILDPACGSGRMLMAASRVAGPWESYYGIDVDHTCVKMTAVNLFLSGLFRAEAMCADALRFEDFRGSYYTSFLPFGLFRVTDRENSRLWHLMRNSCEKRSNKTEPFPFSDKQYPDGSQLTFF